MKVRDRHGNYINHRRRQMIFRRVMFFLSIFIVTAGIAFGAGSMASHAESLNDTHYYKYYTSITVEAGESINSLAAEYGEHFASKKEFINDLIFINHLTDDVLYEGMTLIVPYYSAEFIH